MILKKGGKKDMNNVLVAPSILSADFAKMGEAVNNLAEWKADWVHCDVMDGMFVPNITFGMPMVEALRRNTALPLDVHLMIAEPERYVERFAKAGADIITFHAEACQNADEGIKIVKRCGKKVGLVLNPDIPVESIAQYIDKLDLIMLMGVFPGFGGQKFIPQVLDKIDEVKALVGGRNILIELDGGVTTDNVGEMIRRGLDVVVAGSSVFGAPDPKAAIEKIKNA
ncbi:MAG: ribulose-phosphate 3-epimerase [Clostridia bacterium]